MYTFWAPIELAGPVLVASKLVKSRCLLIVSYKIVPVSQPLYILESLIVLVEILRPTASWDSITFPRLILLFLIELSNNLVFYAQTNHVHPIEGIKTVNVSFHFNLITNSTYI